MVRDWGSNRRVHDVLRRVRDLLDRVLLAGIAYVRGCELKASKDLHAEVFGETLHEQEVTVVFSEVAGACEDCCYVSELAAILGEVLASAETGLRGARDEVFEVFNGKEQPAIGADILLQNRPLEIRIRRGRVAELRETPPKAALGIGSVPESVSLLVEIGLDASELEAVFEVIEKA